MKRTTTEMGCTSFSLH
ncbi:hypothetical protein Zm00014a_000062 [Zea mays]|uniref:Uncharacterized protein n=1 Tax=Zea mays TaxID=4577 RepID=A0A3L6EDY5_MAIZE|nr:hypothetical protein Zm00014a_000062 [Zea mays]